MNNTKRHQTLFTPGPTAVPSKVTEAMSKPTIHHRTKEFVEIFKETAKKYSNLIGTNKLSILLSGSGSLAMNAALDNCISKDEEILVFSAGKFGERWHEIASSLGIKSKHINLEWGKCITPELVIHELKKQNSIKAICIQHCETSTGILYPLEEILTDVKKYDQNILTLVDGITSVGVCPINFDKGLVDVLVCGSQKALMLPPGLSMLTLSDLAWEKVEQTKEKQYYWNLLEEKSVQINGVSKWTPATTLILGLHASLSMIEEEGYKETYKRHENLAALTRAELKKLNFQIYIDSYPAPGLTAALTPEGVNAAELREKLWNQFNIRVAGGHSSLKKRIIRVGHMGDYQLSDIKYLISKITEIINER